MSFLFFYWISSLSHIYADMIALLIYSNSNLISLEFVVSVECKMSFENFPSLRQRTTRWRKWKKATTFLWKRRSKMQITRETHKVTRHVSSIYIQHVHCFQKKSNRVANKRVQSAKKAAPAAAKFIRNHIRYGVICSGVYIHTWQVIYSCNVFTWILFYTTNTIFARWLHSRLHTHTSTLTKYA